MEKYDILLVTNDMTLRGEVFDAMRLHNLTHVLTSKEAEKFILHNACDAAVIDIRDFEDDVEGTMGSLTSRGVEPPIVALVPDYQMDLVARAMSAGAFDYALLPITPERLAGVANKAAEAHNLLKHILLLNPRVIGMEDHPQPVALIKEVAKLDQPVLIRGESGSGADLIARSLHYNSSRRDGPFVDVACATLPHHLLESELFGYEKGAVAGGMIHKAGLAESAEGGTLFLQNIESIDPGTQIRLTKYIDEKRLTPLGAEMSVPWDARIISTTEVEIAERIRERLFRDDLYSLISETVIYLPPLRERKKDIPNLISLYLEKYRRFHRRGPIIFSETILNRLAEYSWPGNLKELEKTIEKYVVAGVMPSQETLPSADEVMGIEPETGALKRPLRSTPLRKAARAAERELIIETLTDYGGNKRKAAHALKISYKTLFNKLHQYNIVTKVGFE